MNRSRNFIFTLNNYTETEVKYIESLACRFLQFGKEVGASGTPHLQGFICFDNQKQFKSVTKLLPRAHVEVMRGSIADNLNYTGKDSNIFKKGEPPMTQVAKGRNGEEYWNNIKKLLEENRDAELPASFTHGQVHLYEHLAANRRKKLVLEDVVSMHDWFWGGPRTGKSRKARELAGGNLYVKRCDKWWCNYEDQDVVLIEDIDPSHAWMLQEIKLWCDRYPFPAAIKGKGDRLIRPKRFIFTSNYAINDIWKQERENEPLYARLTVTEFKI